MQKRKSSQTISLSDDQDNQYVLNNMNTQSQYIYGLLPKNYVSKIKTSMYSNYEDLLYFCIMNLHSYSKVEQLIPLFEQLGGDINTWVDKQSMEDKNRYIFEMLQKNIEQELKKSNQTSSYMNLICTNKKMQKSTKTKDRKKVDKFDWLVLNTKNEMLTSKLKTKLVQTINEYKNQKKLRQVMGRQLQDNQKIHLQDQSIDLYYDDKTKINYIWSKDDEQIFISNIRKLKQKFTQTQFLTNCHRYKFITHSEIKTLAAEEIARKLDKNNKAFLSRQFLLDKFFSANEYLTEKQVKFILKTSPLLSKCVDKAFVRSAIKNIKYEDIDKMQLQIAEQIIEKFEMVRNLVKSSRKIYKQKLNNKVKRRIQIFEKEKEYQLTRGYMNEKLNSHKTKMFRNLNYRPISSTNTNLSKTKNNIQTIYDEKLNKHKKMIWPVPMNANHPSTGLFIKDCSEQLNDDFNDYEKCYLKKVFNVDNQFALKKQRQNQGSMINFYTGGPLDSAYNPLKSDSAFFQKSRNLIPKNQKIDQGIFSTVCELFKISEYHKQLLDKLSTIELPDEDNQSIYTDKKTCHSNRNYLDFVLSDVTNRQKKQEDSCNNSSISNKLANSTEKAIKDRLLQGKQKAKMTVYVNKLHILSAENSFISIKALNAKFTAFQINSLDSKGNTALYYATKHRNCDFIDYLLGMKADVNVKCSKGLTPLHNAFKTNNYATICKCLSGSYAPNLNALDEQGKTPLAYCSHKILQMLNLQDGVVAVSSKEKLKFNNNALLVKTNAESKVIDDAAQIKLSIKKKLSEHEIRC